ncbi:mandelate racemase/muconate lactonizing enzyme family protein [Pseudomonas qingdaonensis]|nr:mandelate racemase/muconate lactonizing enzyme family protein [Pseudomonas qingdaonensis]
MRIYTDSGLLGIGETDSSPAVVKALIETPASHETCQGLRDILVGENPLEIDRLWKKMYRHCEYMGRRGVAIHAISALDIALWDIAGQHYGVPVHTLLGGKYRERIAAYGTFIPRPDEAGNRERVRGLLAQGLRSIKLGGAGFGEDLPRDKALLQLVREEIGDDVQLQIDLVGRWRNYSHALVQCDALRQFNLNWIEEPLPSDDTRGLAYLAERSGLRVSGGEGWPRGTSSVTFWRLRARRSSSPTSPAAAASARCATSMNWRNCTARNWCPTASAPASCWQPPCTFWRPASLAS